MRVVVRGVRCYNEGIIKRYSRVLSSLNHGAIRSSRRARLRESNAVPCLNIKAVAAVLGVVAVVLKNGHHLDDLRPGGGG